MCQIHLKYPEDNPVTDRIDLDQFLLIVLIHSYILLIVYLYFSSLPMIFLLQLTICQ